MKENDKCGMCGVGLLTHRSDVRSWWIIGITQTVEKNVETIFQSTVTTHPTTNSSTNDPIEASDDEEDGCASCSSCMEFLLIFSCFCEGVGAVQGALTLFCGGEAQTCHDDGVVELKEQLVVEEIEGERQERKVKEERRDRVKENAPWMTWR